MIDESVQKPRHCLQPRVGVGGDRHPVDLFRRTEVIDENPRTDSPKFRVRDGSPDVHFRAGR